MKKRISSLMAMLLLIILGSQALYLDNSKELLKFRSIIQEARSMEGLSSEPANSYKPYVVYKDFTLTFYCDDLRNSREGTIYNLNEGANEPEWLKDEKNRNVEKVVFDASFANARPTTTYSWFQNCDIMKEVKGLNYLNTSKVKNMHTMFAFCRKLKSVDVSHFNTKEVQDMGAMFSLCTSLETINLGSFDTSNLWMMMSMFNQCQSLTEINLSSFNTSKVEYFSYLFNGCNSLKKIYLGSGFASTNNASCDETFGECQNLTNIIFTGDIPASINSKFFESVGTTASPATLVVPKQYKANYQAKFDGDSFYGGHFSLQETNAIVGDVNGDGEVNEVDVAEVEKVILDPSIQRLPAMDVNQDGEVNAADIVVIVNIIKIGSNPNTGSGYFWLGTYLPKSSTFPTLGGKEVAGIVTTYTSLDDAMAKASRAYSAGEYAVVMYPSSWGTKDDLVLMDSANKTYYAIKKKVLSDFPDYNYYESTEKIGFNATITLSTETAAKAAGASIYKTPVAPTPPTGNDNTDTELKILYNDVSETLNESFEKNKNVTIEDLQAQLQKFPSSVSSEVLNDILYVTVGGKYKYICDPYRVTCPKGVGNVDFSDTDLNNLLAKINKALYPDETKNTTRVGIENENIEESSALTRSDVPEEPVYLNRKNFFIWSPWPDILTVSTTDPSPVLGRTLDDLGKVKDYSIALLVCHGYQDGRIGVPNNKAFRTELEENKFVEGIDFIKSRVGENDSTFVLSENALQKFLKGDLSKTIIFTAMCYANVDNSVLKEVAKSRGNTAFAGANNIYWLQGGLGQNGAKRLVELFYPSSAYAEHWIKGLFGADSEVSPISKDYTINYTKVSHNENGGTTVEEITVNGTYSFEYQNHFQYRPLTTAMSAINNQPRASVTIPYEQYERHHVSSASRRTGLTRTASEAVSIGFWLRNKDTKEEMEIEFGKSTVSLYNRLNYEQMITRLEVLGITDSLEPGTYEYSTYLVVDGEKEYSKEKYEFKKEETSDQGTSGENKDPIHIIPIYR